MYMIAKLSEDQLASLRGLEEKDGIRLVAVSDLHLDAAELSVDKLAHLREMEERLGVCLVAVK